jgi:hypothetical protein
MNPRNRHPRGYVLLLTLLLLAIAAAALAGVCRLGLRQAVVAARAQDDLQRRWGVLTCRAALIPKAPEVFASLPAARAEARLTLELNGQSVTLVFGDEQAKANVNQMLALHGPAAARTAVQRLSQSAGAASLGVELRPLAIEPDVGDTVADPNPDRGALPDFTVEPVLETWDQVFRAPAAPDLLRRRAPLPSIASNLTCWGDGSVNARRASREAMEAACGKWLRPAEVAKLVLAREKDPNFDLWEALDALGLPEARRDAADRLLTDESTCYSLWIVTRTPGRDWYDLSVAEVTAAGVSGVQVLSW